MCLVADITFDMLMLKMAGIYSAKKSTKIESRGPRYEVADFLVKVGSVSMGPSFRGILVEVEYLPCVVPSSCWDLMREFLQGFMGSTVQGPPQYLPGPHERTVQSRGHRPAVHGALQQFPKSVRHTRDSTRKHRVTSWKHRDSVDVL
ncbi:hypothetical protein MTO96_006400 [Rhipicephalus appendiculatus]